MANRSSRWTGATAAAVVVTLAGVAALGARSVPGTDRTAPVDLQIDAARVISIGFWTLAAVSGLVLVWAVLSTRTRLFPRLQRPRSWVRTLWLLAIAASVVWLLGRFRPEVEVSSTTTTVPLPDAAAPPGTSAAAWVLVVVLAAAGAGVLLAIRRPPAGRPAGPTGEAGEIPAPAGTTTPHGAITIGHRRAVIDAYAAMETLLAERGVARRRPEAPREYLERSAGVVADARADATRLTGLYEVARFSDRPVDRPMETAADDHLQRIRRVVGES